MEVPNMDELIAQLEDDSGLELIDYADNDDWQWIEVKIIDHDKVGYSEILATKVQQHDFKFNGLGDEEGIVRFNRKK